MDKRDYYDTLEVDRSADAASLKKAYRKLAMQFHPDRNPGDNDAEQRFKEVSEAYDILKDDQKRAAYDRFGHQAFENGGGPRSGHGGFDFGNNFSDVFDDLFGEFMGGSRRRQSAAQRGADLRYNLEIDLEAAYSGSEASIEVPSTKTCGECEGSGAEKGSQPETCPTCGGSGKQRTQQGFFMVERTCGACQGAGRIISSPCTTCHGAGRVERDRSLSVKIPAGVEDGTRIRLSGEGDAGVRGGPPGDLYIFVSIHPHKIFKRQNTSLYCPVEISMTTAILGGKIEIETLDGKSTEIKIPEGTQTGERFTLKRKGMPQLNAGFVGDLVVEARIKTPTKLSRKEKELMRQFAKEQSNG